MSSVRFTDTLQKRCVMMYVCINRAVALKSQSYCGIYKCFDGFIVHLITYVVHV